MQEAGDSHVLVVAAVEDDVADDVAVLGGGVAPEHGGGVGPLDGEGSPRAALGQAARPVVVAEYPASIGESIINLATSHGNCAWHLNEYPMSQICRITLVIINRALDISKQKLSTHE